MVYLATLQPDYYTHTTIGIIGRRFTGSSKTFPCRRITRPTASWSKSKHELSSVADWPIKLIWGMKDWCFRPECLDRFVSHWPDADVNKLDSAGHYVVEDAADEVAQLVSEFLERD